MGVGARLVGRVKNWEWQELVTLDPNCSVGRHTSFMGVTAPVAPFEPNDHAKLIDANTPGRKQAKQTGFGVLAGPAPRKDP